MRTFVKWMIVLVCIVVCCTGWMMFVGYRWSWGPFHSFSDYRYQWLDGNKMTIVVEKKKTELSNKNIGFLGSSVTYGAASLGTSFADYIGERNSAVVIKEAVSGTTLVDNGNSSYVSRLKKMDTNQKFDLFIVQLSTNDATKNHEIGTLSQTDSFDTKTICGAIEFIIDYVKTAFYCPIMFYSNAYYESSKYKEMVDLMKKVQEKWDIGFIDMYEDKGFNSISDDDRKLYMSDKIHPTKSGYYYWWTPYMESKMIEYI